MRLKVNDQAVEVNVAPDTPLLWALRDNLNLTGTKYACGIGACGACAVLMNGHLVKSCSTTVASAEGYDIVTIEGLSKDGLHPVQQAWIDEDIPQCGYCTAGQIMSAIALLEDKTNPSEQDIESAMDNICRCGAYSGIKAAIQKVAAERGGT